MRYFYIWRSFLLLGGLSLVFSACGADDEAEVVVFTTEDEFVFTAALEGEDLGTAEDAEQGNTGRNPHPRRRCSVADIRAEAAGEEVNEDAGGQSEERVADEGRERGRQGHERRFRGHGRMRRLKWIYDADESRGRLDAPEKELLLGDLEVRCENLRAYLLAEYDADGSGDLSVDEFQAAREARRQAQQGRRAAFLEANDTDGDGRLSRDEKEAAREARRDAIEARKLELFDANGDGEIDADEAVALREYLREWVRGEHLGEGGPFSS